MLIAQLSDPHVWPEGAPYQGVVDSNAMFASAIAHVNALDPRPDLVLLSGDLVYEGTPLEYRMLRRLLAALAVPVLVIPGNSRGLIRSREFQQLRRVADQDLGRALGGRAVEQA